MRYDGELGYAATMMEIPAAAPVAVVHALKTLEMPSRPSHPSPLARSVEPPISATRSPRVFDVVFPNERLARLDDFVRLRRAAQRMTFLAELAAEGLSPQYYAWMCHRLDALRRANPALSAEFCRRLATP